MTNRENRKKKKKREAEERGGEEEVGEGRQRQTDRQIETEAKT